MSANFQPTRRHLFTLATLGAVLVDCRFAGQRHGLARLPVVPLGVLAWAIHQAIRKLDELQRRIRLDAMTGAFAGTAFVALVVGQLQHANLGIPEMIWAFLWPVQVVLGAVACCMAARRYQ